MKKNYLILFFISIFFTSFSQQTELSLKSGKFLINHQYDLDFSDDKFRLILFEEIPDNSDKLLLTNYGIDFIDYLPSRFFIVSFSKNINTQVLEEKGILSVNKILPDYKIDFKLRDGSFPEWSFKDNLLHIKVLLYKNIQISNEISMLEDFSENISDVNYSSNTVTISINPKDLNLISELSFVFYIEPIDPPGEPENYSGRTLHRSNTINTDYTAGRHYNGDGVNVMMHDDGYVEPHIDRQGRVDESFCSNCSSSSGDSHGDHVSGTIMGAGNLDPLAKGMADGSFLYVLGYSTNNYYQYVPNLYSNYDVVITSASYSNGCNAGYTSLASDLDAQNNLYPSLLHVFSAGNSGSSDCGYGAGSGWGNVTGGHKQAKNVIAVANLTSTGALASSSSRGPAEDGRIKPDIGAKGTSVYSTYPNYSYNSITGTSMACPGISGVMAQLYQAYKEMNNGQNPPSALMKCLLLNSADDLGNPGPDFKNGWGEVNAYRAVKILEDGNYFYDNISQANTNIHSINVPSNVSQLKVMVYWHDKEGSTAASTSLVNDINIQLVTSSGNSYNPWVLDPTPNSSNLNQNAVRGIDNLNNMEQVTINNPVSGNYTLIIDGFTIPFGPQDYYVTYEFIDDQVELTYPIGGESFVPGETELIRWDAIDGGSFSLQYSINGGNTWNNISNNINGTLNHYSWQVPNTVTDQARIRIGRGNSVSQSNTNFTIIDVPSNLSVYWPCPDSINISWNAVNSATSYEISMLGQKYMDSIYTTSSTNVWLINPNPSVTNSWFSVKAKFNNGKGRRAVAENQQAINNVCSGYGCTDPLAYNYSSLAVVNDGSCCYIAGCTDILAINYDSTACFDDGSCIAPILGCTNPSAINFDPNANTTIAYGGALDNTFGTGGYFYGDQHLIFDASKECVIKSAIVYAESANTITFELRNSNSVVIDDTILNVVAGQQRIILNFEVPIGNNMELGIGASNSGLYRNNASASYPYNIGTAINIISSSASSAPYGYYYFFYDIEVQTPCQIPANPSWDCDGQGNCYDPGTGLGQFSSLSQCQSACIVPSWDCDGQGNCYDPGTGLGIYSNLFDCETACSDVSIYESDFLNLLIFPNPSTGNINIQLKSQIIDKITFNIKNEIGQIVYTQLYNSVELESVIELDLSQLSKGVYIMEVDTDRYTTNHKIILR